LRRAVSLWRGVGDPPAEGRPWKSADEPAGIRWAFKPRKVEPKIKGEEDFEVCEGVFDEGTLRTLYKLAKKGFFKYIAGAFGSGKESKIYYAVGNEGEELAIKIFFKSLTEFRKRMKYVTGDPRFEEVRGSPHKIIFLWARKEYVNLQTAFEAGVPVPRPVVQDKNVLIIQFIGKKGFRAPLLAETSPTPSDYRKLVRILGDLYRKAQLVHADFSEYNVFKWGRKLILFDFGSAVSTEHPLARNFLIRDLENLDRFFKKNGVKTLEFKELCRRVTGAEL